YNTDQNLGTRVSEEVVRNSWNIAAIAGSVASVACVRTWYEDFRKDLARITSPTLVIHGDADRIVPYASSGQRTPKLVAGTSLVRVESLCSPVTIRKTLVEQVWRSSQEIVNTPSFWCILDRVTHDAYPETRQGIMIPVRSSIRDSKPPNLASNHTLSLDPRM